MGGRGGGEREGGRQGGRKTERRMGPHAFEPFCIIVTPAVFFVCVGKFGCMTTEKEGVIIMVRPLNLHRLQ